MYLFEQFGNFTHSALRFRIVVEGEINSGFARDFVGCIHAGHRGLYYIGEDELEEYIESHLVRTDKLTRLTPVEERERKKDAMFAWSQVGLSARGASRILWKQNRKAKSGRLLDLKAFVLGVSLRQPVKYPLRQDPPGTMRRCQGNKSSVS